MTTKVSCLSSVSGTITAEFRYYTALSRNVGDKCESTPGILGNTAWSIVLYPGGKLSADGKISCFLKSQSAHTCKASFSLCIVDMNGRDVYVGARQEQVFKSGDTCGYTNFAALPLMTCINNNTLTIRASITLPPRESVGEIIVSGTEDLIFQGEKNSLRSAILSLCGDDSLPHDVWLLAPGPGQNPQEIGAHKFVLAARSSVFRAMLKGAMKEAQRSEVEISDFDSTTVKAFVRFLYSDGCTREALSECAEALLAMADKYEVPALFALCECYLTTHLCSENAMALLCLADAHSAAQLKVSALQYIVGHPKAVAPYAQCLTQDLLSEVLCAFAGCE